jgi:uncharacterized cupin superfamily protein
MSDYEKVYLMELENSAERYGIEGMEARFARKALGSETLGLSYQKLTPGFRQPFGHTHSEQDEAYVILSGTGRIKVEDELVEVAQWDVVRVPAGVTRAIESGDDGLEFIAVGAGPAGDSEIKQGWWGD